MAEHLQNIFGTEKYKVHCPFYFKIGACRHGDRCSRIHLKPTQSQALVLKHMYVNPANQASIVDGQSLEYDEQESLEHFEEFYEDIFAEFSKFGQVEELNVCDNLGEHLVGNVYVKYTHEESAEKCVVNLNGRFYAGKPLYCELSPVTNFGEARCRQFDMGECSRGGYCNFMHLKKISQELEKKLFGDTKRNDSKSRSNEHRETESPEHRSDSRHNSSHNDKNRDSDRDRNRRSDLIDHHRYKKRRERDESEPSGNDRHRRNYESDRSRSSRNNNSQDKQLDSHSAKDGTESSSGNADTKLLSRQNAKKSRRED